MTFAILRCSNKACRKAVRGDMSKAANPHGGKAVTFVGSIKVRSWNGTLQAPANAGAR